jgi:hypothetical protein
MIAPAQCRGTRHDGCAARVKDVEVRLFETREAAAAYARVYEAQLRHRRGNRPLKLSPPGLAAASCPGFLAAR